MDEHLQKQTWDRILKKPIAKLLAGFKKNFRTTLLVEKKEKIEVDNKPTDKGFNTPITYISYAYAFSELRTIKKGLFWKTKRKASVPRFGINILLRYNKGAESKAYLKLYSYHGSHDHNFDAKGYVVEPTPSKGDLITEVYQPGSPELSFLNDWTMALGDLLEAYFPEVEVYK